MKNLSKEIIFNNFYVQSFWDGHPDGRIGELYLTKLEAEAKANGHNPRPGYSYRAKERVAIVGIVPMNQGRAYVFNKLLSEYLVPGEGKISVSGAAFDELMNCYVYRQIYLAPGRVEYLENEFHERGCEIAESYHGYERQILRAIRKERAREFRTELVEHILKHGFQERNGLWINGRGIRIKNVDIKHGTIVLDREKKAGNRIVSQPIDIPGLPLDIRILLESLFGRFVTEINQRERGKVINIACNKKGIDIKKTYHFCCFDIFITK